MKSFFKKENEEGLVVDPERRIKMLFQRVYRNNLRVRDHLAMIFIACGFLAYLLLFKRGESLIFPVSIAIVLVIVSDFLMIILHKRRIRRYREELTELTGIDYVRVDNKDKFPKDTNDLTKQDYDAFLAKLQDAEKVVIKKAQKGEKLSLIEKTLLMTLDERFRIFLDNRGLICYLKLKDIKVNGLTRTKKKSKKKTKK